MLCYQSAPGDVQGTRFCGHEKGALEKKFDMKYMQVNVLINIASMTKIVGDIRTD